MARWYISTLKTNVTKENVHLEFRLKIDKNRKLTFRRNKIYLFDELKA